MIGVVVTVSVSLACIGTGVWLLTTRHAVRAAVPTEEVAPTTMAASAPPTDVSPSVSQTANRLIQELGGDGRAAARIGLSAKDDVSTADKPPGPEKNPKNGSVAPTFTILANDAPEVNEARGVLDAYLAAPTWREKLPHVFRAARCESLMLDFYEKRGEADPLPRAFTGAALITVGESRVVNLSFACPERATSGLRAYFHRAASGKLQLDWEAWTGFSEKAWPDLKTQRSSLPTLVRAIAEQSDEYAYEFREQWRWLAVKLQSPDGVHSITGYCDRRSGMGIALANLIGVPLPQQQTDKDKPGTPIHPPGTKSTVTVRIAFPSNAQSDHCVFITELLADRWMLFDVGQ